MKNILDDIDIDSEVQNLCLKHGIKISARGNGSKPGELDLDYCPRCRDHQIDINVQKGGQWRCYKCGGTGNFISLYNSLEGDGAFNQVFLKKTSTASLNLKKLAKTFHWSLKSNSNALAYFRESRLYDDKTIAHFVLGFADYKTMINDQAYYKNCVVFPVLDRHRENVLNIRFKQAKNITPEKYYQGNVYNVTGYGNVRTFYINYLDKPKKIWVLEGEPDGILVHQMLRVYYPSLLNEIMIISSTAGTQSIPLEWDEDFFSRAECTTIFYDCDEAGVLGATNVNRIAKNSKIADLRHILVSESDNDITDLARQIGLKRTIDYLFLLEELATSENNNLLIKREFNAFKQEINQKISKVVNGIDALTNLESISESITKLQSKTQENETYIKNIRKCVKQFFTNIIQTTEKDDDSNEK